MMEGAEKLLNSAKGWPIWMLAALASVAVAACLMTPLQTAVPANFRANLPLVAAALVAMTVFGGLARLFKQVHSRAQARATVDLARLQQVYSPLVALFMRRHVTASTGILAPRFENRLANAKAELVGYRRLSVGVRSAIIALGDRRMSTSAEVEFGGDFPLTEIHDLVLANAALAGRDLINLVRRADRAGYEDGGAPGLISHEEMALFLHIQGQYQRLSKRVGM